MLPIQITSRDLPLSPALEALIRKRAEKLSQYFNRISSCRIIIEMTQKHKTIKFYNLRIDVTVPGKELVTTRKNDEDIYVAIRDAFDAMVRQLEAHAQKRHGQVKKHNEIAHGHVSRIMSQEGYGFITGTDGNDYYFSMTNMSHPQFEQLAIGDPVEYISEPLKEGRQAQHVKRVNKNNSHE